MRHKFKRLIGDDATVDTTEDGPTAAVYCHNMARQVAREVFDRNWHPDDFLLILMTSMSVELGRATILQRDMREGKTGDGK